MCRCVRGPPVIDLRGERSAVVREIDLAVWGAFVAVGHGVNEDLLDSVLKVGHRFFDLDPANQGKV